MKILLFMISFVPLFGMSQTNIIAAKSHSAAILKSSIERDNFGLPNETRIVQTVEYLQGDCLVETAEVSLFETRIEIDTICNHPFLQQGQIDINRIKSMYPDDVKFIGFENLKDDEKVVKKRLRKEKKANAKASRRNKSSVLILFFIGGGLFLLYLFKPNFSKTHA